MISQDGFTFGAPAYHGRPISAARYARIRSFTWHGVAGESHLTSPPAGFDVFVECGWEAVSEVALEAIENGLAEQAGRLFGDLTVQQSGRPAIVKPQCTFVGYEPAAPGRLDPHRGWFLSGRLLWRSRVTPVPAGA
ncbi:hypothetical protein [Alienimonas sp. DA493]|uniref:hypothetical protein n=1 Tax=Alienimonas sp. DA493 TaxID=3373605 RepID=UPI0037553463